VAQPDPQQGGVSMDRWQYLLVLAACLVITIPLEFLGTGVYRRLGRAARAILPVAAIFVVWDLLAIAAEVWWYNPQYVTGVHIGPMPLEELLFFLVIPLCGLLTYSAVEGILARVRRIRERSAARRS
jgi:lycopene cyclase domain-containing protein